MLDRRDGSDKNIPMLESILVVLIVGAVMVFWWVMTTGLPSLALTEIGVLILAIGIIEGIPTGLYYHIVLYRILKRRDKLPPGWWKSPTKYHVHLTDEENRRVRRWFVLGGLGFLFCLVGGFIAFLGILSTM